MYQYSLFFIKECIQDKVWCLSFWNWLLWIKYQWTWMCTYLCGMLTYCHLVSTRSIIDGKYGNSKEHMFEFWIPLVGVFEKYEMV